MRSTITAALGGLKPLVRPLLGTVTSVSTERKVAALTFDDGPHPVATPRLLDVLEGHGARATFFMLGARARGHPDLVARVSAAGHAVANHSWDHPSFAHRGPLARVRQIRRCAAALRPHGQRLFRFPGGHQTPLAVLEARLLRHEVVGWSVDPRDYEDRTARDIAEHVSSALQPGSVVLLHDALFEHPTDERIATVEAVGALLARHPDWRFVTVPELFRHGPRRRIHAFWRPEGDPFRRPPDGA